MNIEITRQGPVEPQEIEDLRAEVGWDRSRETYGEILKRHFAYYTARDADGRLIGYVSVLSDGVSDAFLLDLMVHPNYQRMGIGKRLVQSATRDVKAEGIQCVQVTFNPELEDFYAKCGFHIFKGGIIDFKSMEWDGECQQGAPADADEPRR